MDLFKLSQFPDMLGAEIISKTINGFDVEILRVWVDPDDDSMEQMGVDQDLVSVGSLQDAGLLPHGDPLDVIFSIDKSLGLPTFIYEKGVCSFVGLELNDLVETLMTSRHAPAKVRQFLGLTPDDLMSEVGSIGHCAGKATYNLKAAGIIPTWRRYSSDKYHKDGYADLTDILYAINEDTQLVGGDRRIRDFGQLLPKYCKLAQDRGVSFVPTYRKVLVAYQGRRVHQRLRCLVFFDSDAFDDDINGDELSEMALALISNQ